MGYVMVPVPEEHAAELQQELMKLALRDSIAAWTEESLAGLVDQLDGGDRALLQELLRSPRSGNHRALGSVAEAMGADDAVVMDTANAINAICSRKGWPPLLLAGNKAVPGGGPPLRTLYLVSGAAAGLDRLIGDDPQPS